MFSLSQGMWGPNEFTANGVLKDLDGAPELPRIAAPTLLTCGEHDEATPATTRRFAQAIPGAELVVFDNASHFTFVEAPEKYMAVMRKFVEKLESARLT